VPRHADAADRSLHPAASGYVTDPGKKKEWSESCALLLELVHAPKRNTFTPETLEEEAGALVDAMTGASHDVFKPRQLLRGEAQKWWNAECTDVLEKVQGAD
jgi:hypothetical protein